MPELEPPLVYVVMLTWNQCDDTLECLQSVFQMTYPRYEVMIVDNGSTDGTHDAVMARYPQVQYLMNETNRGFAAAANHGIRRAFERGADYFFLLNNDTVVNPEMLDCLMRHTFDDSVGMLVPKIYYYGQPQMIWSVGAELNCWTLEKKGDACGRVDNGEWDTVIEREYVTACAVLLPRRLIEKIGMLDERFFYYYDDGDLSLRVLEAGYKILLVPQAKVWHKVARASGGSDTPYQRYWLGRSSVLFFRKHTRGWRWLIVGPYRTVSTLRTTWKLFTRRKLAALSAYWHGLYDGLTKS